MALAKKAAHTNTKKCWEVNPMTFSTGANFGILFIAHLHEIGKRKLKQKGFISIWGHVINRLSLIKSQYTHSHDRQKKSLLVCSQIDVLSEHFRMMGRRNDAAEKRLKKHTNEQHHETWLVLKLFGREGKHKPNFKTMSKNMVTKKVRAKVVQLKSRFMNITMDYMAKVAKVKQILDISFYKYFNGAT